MKKSSLRSWKFPNSSRTPSKNFVQPDGHVHLFRQIPILVPILSQIKADSYIACRSHAASMSFPCHAVPLKWLIMCLSHLIYTVWPCVIHTCHVIPMPCSDRAFLLKATAQHGHLSTAVLCCGLEKNGMVRAWHGKCESDTAALCKSNGKDTF